MVTSSDGSSLRLGPGSARARHLEGLLELGFCRLDPSIGRGQASGSSLRPQARARLELGNWRLDPSLPLMEHFFTNFHHVIMSMIEDIYKKFKDIGRQNLIQNSL